MALSWRLPARWRRPPAGAAPPPFPPLCSPTSGSFFARFPPRPTPAAAPTPPHTHTAPQIPDEEEEEDFTQEEMEALEEAMQSDFEIAEMIKWVGGWWRRRRCGVACALAVGLRCGAQPSGGDGARQRNGGPVPFSGPNRRRPPRPATTLGLSAPSLPVLLSSPLPESGPGAYPCSAYPPTHPSRPTTPHAGRRSSRRQPAGSLGRRCRSMRQAVGSGVAAGGRACARCCTLLRRQARHS